eukprot:SAG22_NODE_1825_length_3505_cov_3.818849_4_plen_181_part_00
MPEICLSSCPSVLDVTQNKTYDVLATFLAEMAEIFPDPVLMLGGACSTNVMHGIVVQSPRLHHSLWPGAGLCKPPVQTPPPVRSLSKEGRYVVQDCNSGPLPLRMSSKSPRFGGLDHTQPRPRHLQATRSGSRATAPTASRSSPRPSTSTRRRRPGWSSSASTARPPPTTSGRRCVRRSP